MTGRQTKPVLEKAGDFSMMHHRLWCARQQLTFAYSWGSLLRSPILNATTMRHPPRVGTTGRQEFVVAEEHAIDFADDQMPAVLCTPSLIWFLEHAARDAVLPVLEPGESTVGVSIQVEHLAPTPLGKKVTCTARIILVDGTFVSFQLEAHDAVERIARGSHKLGIIQKDRFARRVQQKNTSG